MLLAQCLAAAAGLGLARGHGGHSHGGGGSEGPTNVVELTTANFDELVGQDKAVVMDFYAPWCGHCKTLKPELEKLATTFLDSEDVLITKLNGEAFPEYSYRFGVRGFPTIFWFPAGAEKPTQEYWGDRHASALMSWIHGKLEEPNPFKDDPKEPLPEFDLSGMWIDGDGGQMVVTQEKHSVTAKPSAPQHWSSAHGRIKGHTIPHMPFNTIVLAATISDDENTIEWDNGVVWTRVIDDPAAAAADAGEDGGAAGDDAAAAEEKAAEPAAPEGDGDAAAPEKAAEAGDTATPPPTPAAGTPEPQGAQADGGAAAATKEEPEAAAETAEGKVAPAAPAAAGGGAGGTQALMKANAELKKAKTEADHAKQELASATAKSDAKAKSSRKELMTCREQTLALQTDIEKRDQYVAVLYCTIGVLGVLLCFMACRGMGSAADAADGDEEAEWAEERHSQMRSQIGAGGAISKAL